MELADYKGLLVMAARRQMGRLIALNKEADFLELMQEAAVVFLRCKQGFDATKAKFSTYLVNALNHHFNMEFTRLIQRSCFEGVTDDGLDPGEASDGCEWSADPAEQYDRAQRAERLMQSLSPPARALATAVLMPVDEFNRRYGTAQAENDRFFHVKSALIAQGVLTPHTYNRAKAEIQAKVASL